MSGKYVMALDQGTTSCRCILYDRMGQPASTAQKEFRQIYPREGWVEHDPMEIWSVQLEVARESMKKIHAAAEDIVCLGITNQRETAIVWDRQTGRPVYNAIVWQCRRTAEFCDQLRKEGLDVEWRHKTGLLIDAYFSGTKLRWILENVEGARERAEKGELLFGTVETWLIWNLSGGRVHVTDCSNASRTMMFNIRTLRWDEEILQRLDIPLQMLPEVKTSSEVYGETEPRLFGRSIPISGAAGDQQAALFGQACFEKGQAKNTYGTGGFMLVNTGENIVSSKNGLLSTIGWCLDGKVSYALEGSVFVSGATIQWLRDGLQIIRDGRQAEEMARKVEDTAGCYLVPAFTGLGAPWWDPYARGAILGLTRGVTREHIARAALESMAYQVWDLMQAMKDDMGQEINMFRVDGGASANNFLLEFQAGIIGLPVYRPCCIETTSLGAAYLAGLAVGFWRDKEEILDVWKLDRKFEPEMDEKTRLDLLDGWHHAVKRTLGKGGTENCII